jgi:hypothetical protein
LFFEAESHVSELLIFGSYFRRHDRSTAELFVTLEISECCTAVIDELDRASLSIDSRPLLFLSQSAFCGFSELTCAACRALQDLQVPAPLGNASELLLGSHVWPTLLCAERFIPKISWTFTSSPSSQLCHYMREPHHLLSFFISALLNIPRFDVVEGLVIAPPAVWLLCRMLTVEPKFSTSLRLQCGSS